MHVFVGFEVVSFVDLDFLSTNEVFAQRKSVPIHPTKIGDGDASADLGLVMTLCDFAKSQVLNVKVVAGLFLFAAVVIVGCAAQKKGEQNHFAVQVRIDSRVRNVKLLYKCHHVKVPSMLPAG